MQTFRREDRIEYTFQNLGSEEASFYSVSARVGSGESDEKNNIHRAIDPHWPVHHLHLGTIVTSVYRLCGRDHWPFVIELYYRELC